MNIQDRKKSLTAEDLRRRYNLDGLEKDRKSIQLVKDTLNKVEIEFQNFIDIIKKVLNEYQNQADITVWFFDGIPTSTQPEILIPSNHLGDLYYDRQTGNAFQYVYDNEYLWEETTDRDIVQTLAVESSKADTSDNKRIVFNGIPTTPYSIGDVWINGGIYYRCRAARQSGTYNIVDWVLYTDYTEDMVLLDTRAVLDQFKTTVEQDYVTTTQLETNTQGIYGRVSETYSTKTEVSNAIDGVAVSFANYQETNETRFEQLSNSFQANISSVISSMNSNDDATNQRINEINNYIRYALESGVGVVTIGTTSSNILLKVRNDRISFTQNNTEVAYISDNRLYITDGQFLNSLRIGNFAFIPRSNGSLSFRKVV